MADSSLQISFAADASGVGQAADQAKAAISGIGPQIQSLGKSFGEFAKTLKDGVDGVTKLGAAFSGLAKGGANLDGVTRGVKGAADAIAGAGKAAPVGLGAISQAASGLVGVAAAMGQAAIGAASATAEWAARTAASSTATSEARQNAANLNGAIEDAQKAFGGVGDTLANAFAPVLATVINAIADLAKGFETSFQKGGLAKQIADLLILAFKLLAAGVELAIGAIIAIIDAVRTRIQVWKDEFDVAKDFAIGIVNELRIAFDALGRLFVDVLSGNFGRAVSDFKAGLADMAQAWRQTLGQLGTDARAARADGLGGDREAFGALVGAGREGARTFLGRPQTHAPPPISRERKAGGSGVGATAIGGAHECVCDPAEAAACAKASEDGKTTQAASGAQAREQIAKGSNDRIAAGNRKVTEEYKADQHGQANAANESDRAKEESSSRARKNITADNDRILAQFKSALDGVVSSFVQGLGQVVQGTRSFGQVMRSIGQQVLSDIQRVVEGLVEKWAWGVAENVLASTRGQAFLDALGLKGLAQAVLRERAKTAAALTGVTARTAATAGGASADLAATGASAIADIGTSAAKAAAATWAAVVQAFGPLGPFIAPALAAAALAAVLDYKGLVRSAAGGFDIPAGLNPITQLHAQEMVLPARLANPLRDLLSSGASARSGGFPAGGGDVHHHTHHWSVSALDGPSVERLLRTHGDRLVKVLNERIRANAGVQLGFAR